MIWKRVVLPAWRNRPFPRQVVRNHRVMLLLAGICGVTTLAGFFFLERGGFSAAIVGVCFTIAYLSGGFFATQDFWAALKHGKIDIQFLMIAVAVGALFVNAWTEGATLLFLFSLSNGLEQFANHRTRKSIESLLKVAPKQALRRAGSGWSEVPIEEVVYGDELFVKPGELFPVDGVIIDGSTSADESALTGESIPVAKQIGDAVSGGTLNLDGQCVVRATRELGQSALNRILALIEQAQQQKAPAQRFTDSFSRYYTWFALSLSVVVFAVLFAQHRPLANAFYRAMTLLVVASPCALVLSIPSAVLAAIAAGARHGILFRGGAAVEKLASATFALDKTGTLTKGIARRRKNHRVRWQTRRGFADGGIRWTDSPPIRSRARSLRRQSKRNVRPIAFKRFLNRYRSWYGGAARRERIFLGSRRFSHDRGVFMPFG